MTEKVRGFHTRLGKDGRVTIPLGLREALGLKEGDKIQVTEIRKTEPE